MSAQATQAIPIQVGDYVAVQALEWGRQYAQSHFVKSWATAEVVGKVTRIIVPTSARQQLQYELGFINDEELYIIRAKSARLYATAGLPPDAYVNPRFEIANESEPEWTDGEDFDTDPDDLPGVCQCVQSLSV